jgi:hypothetical protein
MAAAARSAQLEALTRSVDWQQAEGAFRSPATARVRSRQAECLRHDVC